MGSKSRRLGYQVSTAGILITAAGVGLLAARPSFLAVGLVAAGLTIMEFA